MQSDHRILHHDRTGNILIGHLFLATQIEITLFEQTRSALGLAADEGMLST
jgi:hypothetical protein